LHLPQKTPTAASRLRAAFGTDTPLSAPTTTTHQAFVASGASAGLSVGRASTPKGKVVHRSPGMHRLQRASTAPPPSNTTPVSGELTEAQAELAFMLGDAFGSAKLALDCLCAAQDSQGGLSDASFQHLVAAERLNEERAADRDVGKSGEQPGIASRLWQAISKEGSRWISTDDLCTILVPLTHVPPETAEEREARRLARENEKFLARGTVSQKALQFERRAKAVQSGIATAAEAKTKGSPPTPVGSERQKVSPVLFQR